MSGTTEFEQRRHEPRHPGAWRRASAMLAAAAALLVSTASAFAEPAKIGSATVSGQASGHLVIPLMKTAAEGVPSQGCQITPADTDETLALYFANEKLHVSGKSVSAVDITSDVLVAKEGTHESLGPVKNGNDPDIYPNSVVFSIVVSGKTYNWQSVSGTIKTSAGAKSGSFSAELDPVLESEGKPNTPATSPVHMTVSWSSCHPLVETG